jgi:hypothetical protein
VVLLLVDRLQALGADRLHADVDVQAAAGTHQVEHLAVVADVGRAEAGPVDLQGPEAFHHGERVLAVGVEDVIHEVDELAPAELHQEPDLLDDLLGGPIAEPGAVDLGDLAVAARVRAAPGGLRREVGDPVAAQVDQVVAGRREPLEVGERGTLVAAPEPA